MLNFRCVYLRKSSQIEGSPDHLHEANVFANSQPFAELLRWPSKLEKSLEKTAVLSKKTIEK